MAERDIEVKESSPESPIEQHPNKENLDNNPIPVKTDDDKSKCGADSALEKDNDVDTETPETHSAEVSTELKAEKQTGEASEEEDEPKTLKKVLQKVEVSIPLTRIATEVLNKLQAPTPDLEKKSDP